eukprot:TRINITY_DN7380_c0_g1_i1.p1 TRINITY_DN7380_c0_g1~~TRINITY_DN7380_c0_g1_i1.p1  ORF type:complete len:175 (-),score=25.79 TRINITY_DN7380_c0_g1_i1:231-755(-)
MRSYCFSKKYREPRAYVIRTKRSEFKVYQRIIVKPESDELLVSLHGLKSIFPFERLECYHSDSKKPPTPQCYNGTRVEGRNGGVAGTVNSRNRIRKNLSLMKGKTNSRKSSASQYTKKPLVLKSIHETTKSKIKQKSFSFSTRCAEPNSKAPGFNAKVVEDVPFHDVSISINCR